MLDRPSGFQLQTSGDMPKVATHRAALELVMRNLIANSIAHRDGSQGQVVLSATQDGDWVEVSDSPRRRTRHFGERSQTNCRWRETRSKRTAIVR